MENKKTKNIVSILAIVIVILLAVILIMWNTLKNNEKKSKTTYEAEQLELFSNEYLDDGFRKTYEDLDPTMDLEETKYDIYNHLSNATKSFAKDNNGENSEAVDAYAAGLKTTIMNATSVEELKEMLGSILDIDIMGFVTGLLGGSSMEPTNSLTLKSNTACTSSSVSDSKFCIDNLSANVYVKDANTTNWAVVVHPFMTSGSLMYSSVGAFYTEAGYNVLAPDLRGFGNSGGSVAMGYLESLDIYDWIKDLNENPTRYGVNSAPTNIIVHGVSLGGATTLQLATNPDIAAAKGGAYTKNLTQLHVNGFVDDCGYTSMSGIITGMFSAFDISSLTSSLDSLGISLEGFMTEMQDLLKKMGIEDLANFDIKSLFNNSGNIKDGKFEEVKKYFESIMNLGNIMDYVADGSSANGVNSEAMKDAVSLFPGMNTNNLEEIFGSFYSTGSDYVNNLQGNWNKYYSSGNNNDKTPENNTVNTPENNEGNTTENNNGNTESSSTQLWDKINGYVDKYSDALDKYSNIYKKDGADYQVPTTPSNPTKPSNWNNWYSSHKTSTIGGMTPTLINNSTTESENFLDGLISAALIKLVGVGLTEDNYSYYSDVFAEGRRFPAGSNVAIIHGTSDTTVPHSNADTVASNIPSDVTLTKKWDAEGMPHAFVIIGSEKENYGKFVKEFSNCVANNSCTKTQ